MLASVLGMGFVHVLIQLSLSGMAWLFFENRVVCPNVVIQCVVFPSTPILVPPFPHSILSPSPISMPNIH